MKSKYSFTILFLIMTIGCTKDTLQRIVVKPNGCDSTAFSYARNIRPIVESNCSGPTCHSGGNSNYNYSTYEVLADRIRTGRLEERLVLPTNHPLHMPEGFSLDVCDLFILRTWIHQGLKKN